MRMLNCILSAFMGLLFEWPRPKTITLIPGCAALLIELAHTPFSHLHANVLNCEMPCCTISLF